MRHRLYRHVNFPRTNQRRFYRGSVVSLFLWGLDSLVFGHRIFSAPNYAGFHFLPLWIWELLFCSVASIAWVVAPTNPRRGLFLMTVTWSIITILFALGAWYGTAVIAYGFITYIGLRILQDVT